MILLYQLIIQNCKNISFGLKCMVIQIFLLIFTVACYKLILLPWRRYKNMIRLLESLNYKVYSFPYAIIGGQVFKLIKKDQKDHGDPFYSMKRAQGYDLVVSTILDKIWIKIINPELLKEFYAADKVQIYHKSKLVSGVVIKIAGNGIAFAQDEQWRKRRKIMTKVFTFEFVKQLVPMFIKTVDKNFDQMENSEGYPKVILLQHLLRITGDATATAFFGDGISDKKIMGMSLPQMIHQMLNQVGQVSSSPLVILLGPMIVQTKLTSSFRRVLRAKEQYEKVILDFIRQNRVHLLNGTAVNRHSILHSIEEYNKSCSQQKDKFTDRQILSEFSSIFGAGLENPAHYTQTLLFNMGMYSEIKQKVVKQIESRVKGQKDFNLDNFKTMEYLQSVQKENFRMYGPGNSVFIRQVMKDHLLGNIPIPKGTLLGVDQIPNNFIEKYYPDPYVFKPERWINDAAKINERPGLVGNHFSSGPKSCFGKNFALLLIRIAVIRFLQRYDYELVKKQLKFVLKSNFSPKEPLVILKKRQSNDPLIINLNVQYQQFYGILSQLTIRLTVINQTMQNQKGYRNFEQVSQALSVYQNRMRQIQTHIFEQLQGTTRLMSKIKSIQQSIPNFKITIEQLNRMVNQDLLPFYNQIVQSFKCCIELYSQKLQKASQHAKQQQSLNQQLQQENKQLRLLVDQIYQKAVQNQKKYKQKDFKTEKGVKKSFTKIDSGNNTIQNYSSLTMSSQMHRSSKGKESQNRRLKMIQKSCQLKKQAFQALKQNQNLLNTFQNNNLSSKNIFDGFGFAKRRSIGNKIQSQTFDPCLLQLENKNRSLKISRTEDLRKKIGSNRVARAMLGYFDQKMR